MNLVIFKSLQCSKGPAVVYEERLIAEGIGKVAPVSQTDTINQQEIIMEVYNMDTAPKTVFCSTCGTRAAATAQNACAISV